ncbi:hypothetical protein V5O48_004814 [Marasmius crinis-equi]|uniref:Enoyl reductase (ER) domain-containing protein n=1 Tax=Marasmius crinis-equi TaxID=585013 RepID=A0ABR3FPF8_9AGAR
MSSQKALHLTKGSPFVLAERDIPAPAKGELLVKVHAAALNPVDWKVQAGYIGQLSEKNPVIIGADAAGEVVRVGEDVDFSVGDRVVFQSQAFNNDYAGYQQFTKVPIDLVAKIPKSVTYAEAASVPSGLATAAIGLLSEPPRGAGLDPSVNETLKYSNQPALVVGGSSSVGQYAIQLLRYLNFSPIITYASGHHTTYLKSLGATHVVDRKSVELSNLPAEIRKITQTPVKTIYDAVGLADTQQAAYASLADDEGATLVLVLPSLLQETTGKKKVYSTLGVVTDPGNRKFAGELFRKVERFLADGTIVPNKVEELPNGLEGVQGGLERLRGNQVSGVKLVALPQETK